MIKLNKFKNMKFTTILKRGQKTITLTTLAFLIIALIVTFAQPLKYKTSAKILVIQEFGPEADPFTVSRLNEYLSTSLANVIQSESFFQQTLNAGFNFDNDYFSGSQRQQMKKWRNAVKARALYDSGLMTITVYHPDSEQAQQLTHAIIKTLATKNNFYHSIQNVDIRIIDSPSVSVLPVKPNVILNILVGIILGAMIGIWLVYREENK